MHYIQSVHLLVINDKQRINVKCYCEIHYLKDTNSNLSGKL